MAEESPKGPFKLITVNTAPERAFRLVGRVTDALKAKYTVVHVANCQAIEEVEEKVSQYQPELLMCASMWTPEQAEHIQSIARQTKPGIKTYAIPQGMQVDKGPDFVVEHLENVFPGWLDS